MVELVDHSPSHLFDIYNPLVLEEKDNKIALNTEFNSQILGTVIRRHWFLPIIYVSFVCALAFFYLRYTKPMYRSNAVIQIIEEDKVSDVLGKSAFVMDDRVLSKEVELLKSDVLFEKTISNFR